MHGKSHSTNDSANLDFHHSKEEVYPSSNTFLTMAVNIFTCFPILLLTSFHVGRNLAIHIDINPEIYDQFIHDKVNITCSPDGDDNKEKKIVLMEIVKNEKKPIVVIRRGRQLSFPNGNNNQFVAEGHISDNVSQSHLVLTLENFKSSDSGLYSCVMHFMDEIGLLKMEKSSLNLTEERMDMKTLEKSLKFIKDKVEKTNEEAADYRRQISVLSKKVADQSRQISGLSNKASYMTAFSATNKDTRITTSNGTILILPDVIMRHGKGYDESTGVFTSPREGIYAFHVVVTNSRTGYSMAIDLKANDKVIARLYAYEHDTWEQSSMSSVVHLKTGDRVFCFSNSYGAYVPRDRYSVFTGYLVHVL